MHSITIYCTDSVTVAFFLIIIQQLGWWVQNALTFMGSAMPKQCCQAVIRVNMSHFGDDIVRQETSILFKLLKGLTFLVSRIDYSIRVFQLQVYFVLHYLIKLCISFTYTEQFTYQTSKLVFNGDLIVLPYCTIIVYITGMQTSWNQWEFCIQVTL